MPRARRRQRGPRDRLELLRSRRGRGLLLSTLTRRELLRIAATAAAAWRLAPWPVRPPRAFAQTLPGDPVTVMTLEAFADTLIPGEKRSPADRAIAGAATGPGAVQAGALELMNFPAAGTAPALPALAAGLNALATQYAAQHGIVLDPTVPPLVSLDFDARTAFLVEVIDGGSPDAIAYFALAGIAFVAYHTAGHLHTATEAFADPPHPGLAAIHFPPPAPDGKWHFTEFSYGRALATKSPLTRRGSPG